MLGMARSAKDLRDIINVSRLSIRDYSSDEFSSSGGELDLPTDPDVEAVGAYISARPSSVMRDESNFQTFTISTRPGSARTRRPNSATTNKKLVKHFRPDTAPVRYFDEKDYSSKLLNEKDMLNVSSKARPTFPNKLVPIPPITKAKPEEKPSEFNDLFQYLDGTVISSWLEECNSTLTQISEFMNKEDNFVEFSNFFLTTLDEDQYAELLALEYSIIIDQLNFAFHAGLSSGKVTKDNIKSLTQMVLKEYPTALTRRTTGPKLLLDIIVIFSCEKDECYRKLLKNIKYSCCNKQIVQWLLAIRAFGLISFISGVLRFYENIKSLQERSFLSPNICVSSSSLSDMSKLHKWSIQSVCKNYVEVIQYLYENQHVNLQDVYDGKKRNLIFIAAIEGHVEMISFLAQDPICVNGNQPSVNGNTVLHFIVTKGDHELVKSLLEIGLNPNVWNAESEGATPLHSAVISGDLKMVTLLLNHGADPTTTMGVPATITPMMLAQQLGYHDIAAALKQ